jgi:hypothetical protein
MSNEKDETFHSQVETWIAEQLEKGVNSFSELASRLHGVYPTEIAAGIRRLGHHSLLQNVVDSKVALHRVQSQLANNGLPVAHPLDFDWRFSFNTAKELVRLALDRKKVAVFGAPSLVEPLLESSVVRPFVFDANPMAVEHVRNRHPSVSLKLIDLLCEQIQSKSISNVTFCDPPWYEQHTKSFLWAAAFATRLGGRVYCSFPPIGTRPRIAQERERIFDWTKKVGLHLIEIQPARLEYVTPLFERNALRASNTPVPICDWRKGDLAIFETVDDNTLPFEPQESARDRWTETVLGTMRIKLRIQNGNAGGDPRLQSIVDGDVLDSVSRRDTRRAKIDVWTSGNRVFRCANTELLKLIVQSVEQDLATADFLQDNSSQELIPSQLRAAIHVARQLSEISAIEQRENAESFRYNLVK